MRLGAVAIGDDRLQTSTIFGRDQGTDDARLSQLEPGLEPKFETKLAQVQNRRLASEVAQFVLLGIAILLK